MRKVFVHRYKWSHDNRRKQLRKALKDNKVVLLERTHDGWLYGIPKDFKEKIK